MIETEAVFEPEAGPPASRSRRNRRAALAGVTLLALVAGGVAVSAGGSRPEAEPLALLAGNGAGGRAETMATPTGTPAPVAPAIGAADSARSSFPYPGGWGLTFQVEGPLPELPDHAPAWRVTGPDLDGAALGRIADALGVNGTPVQRDGGWFVDGGDWTLSAYGGDAMGKGGNWYLNLYRSPFDGRADDAPASDTTTGPAISRAEATQRVLDLLDRMGAPRATWNVETTDTEIGIGWGCAVPTPAVSPDELKQLEEEKLRQVEGQTVEGQTAANSGGATPSRPGSAPGSAPDIAPACPPPPAPVKGFNVAVSPLLDGRRADWPVWNVTLRSDGQIENLSGSWVSFERGDDYRLRGVSAALKDLQSAPVAYATDAPAAAIEPATIEPAAIEPATGTSASAIGPAVEPPIARAPAVDLPAPPQPQPQPQVVKITGVELGLMQTSVFENGQVRLAMVPSYRFTGHFDNGTPWETPVLALHPDAIAPPPAMPPAVPVTDDVRAGAGVSTSAGVAEVRKPG